MPLFSSVNFSLQTHRSVFCNKLTEGKLPVFSISEKYCEKLRIFRQLKSTMLRYLFKHPAKQDCV